MTVVHTQPLLYKMSELLIQHKIEKVEKMQLNIICEPLKNLYPEVPEKELHFDLLSNGLFDPYEELDLHQVVKKLEEQKT